MTMQESIAAAGVRSSPTPGVPERKRYSAGVLLRDKELK
jgi:hypothetical protein